MTGPGPLSSLSVGAEEAGILLALVAWGVAIVFIEMLSVSHSDTGRNEGFWVDLDPAKCVDVSHEGAVPGCGQHVRDAPAQPRHRIVIGCWRRGVESIADYRVSRLGIVQE